MTEKWKLDRAKRWCKKLTLAHFSVVLDTQTQKAVIVRYDGSIWRDVPDVYQVATVELLHSGETFTAQPIQPVRHERSYRAESSTRATESMKIANQFAYLSPVRPRLALVS
jgi:hypothetical protein